MQTPKRSRMIRQWTSQRHITHHKTANNPPIHFRVCKLKPQPFNLLGYYAYPTISLPAGPNRTPAAASSSENPGEAHASPDPQSRFRADSTHDSPALNYNTKRPALTRPCVQTTAHHTSHDRRTRATIPQTFKSPTCTQLRHPICRGGETKTRAR